MNAITGSRRHWVPTKGNRLLLSCWYYALVLGALLPTSGRASDEPISPTSQPVLHLANGKSTAGVEARTRWCLALLGGLRSEDDLTVKLARSGDTGEIAALLFPVGKQNVSLATTALHAVGLASQPTSTRRGDGLELRGVRITMPVHCAPPENKPTPAERDTCLPWLARELDLLAPEGRLCFVALMRGTNVR